MFLPYLEAGWNVVNVEYRLARVSLAPGAVEDAMCALRWTIHNAKQYNIDTRRIVASGNSAGGHLALAVGMIPAEVGLDRQCPGPEELKVAAIVNWYGISDVADLLDGPNMKAYAVTWLGSMENRKELARRVSPIAYVRAGLPPIISIQANQDPTVPYEQTVALACGTREGRCLKSTGDSPGKHSRQLQTRRVYSDLRRDPVVSREA